MTNLLDESTAIAPVWTGAKSTVARHGRHRRVSRFGSGLREVWPIVAGGPHMSADAVTGAGRDLLARVLPGYVKDVIIDHTP